MTNPKPDDLEAVRKVVDALTGFEVDDQERIVRWACEKVGLIVGRLGATAEPSAATHAAEGPAPLAPRGGGDIRSFIETKNPSSNTQFAATVAYYYRFEAPEHLRKDSITAEDLQEACRQVNRGRISRPAQTLIDAHGQGLLDRGERGSYTINTVGENLVAMALPSDAAHVATPKVRARRRAPGAPVKKRVTKNRR